ncbi:MAG: hypothetical protein V1794_17215 [Candidatus Glassbacteria bacterium]
MKAAKFLAALMAFLLVVLAGCVHMTYTPASSGQKYDPTDQVRLLRNYPDTPHTVIGSYRATGESESKILKKLVAEAKKVGANALVVKPPEVRSNSYTSEMRTEFTRREVVVEAIAIRFNQPEGK